MGEPGKGACFRLTLPLVRGHKVTTSPLPLRPVAAERRDPQTDQLRALRQREAAGERV